MIGNGNLENPSLPCHKNWGFLIRYTALPLKETSFKYTNNHSCIVVFKNAVNIMFQQSLNVFFRFGMKHSNKVLSQLYRTQNV